jgi:GGDEF domain-containing protein
VRTKGKVADAEGIAAKPSRGAKSRSETVAARFFVLLAVLVIGMIAEGAAAIGGLGKLRAELEAVYTDNIRTLTALDGLSGAVRSAEDTAQQLTSTTDPAMALALERELRDSLAPRVESGIVELRSALADEPQNVRATVDGIEQGWRRFRDEVWTAQGLVPPGADVSVRSSLSGTIASIFDPMTAQLDAVSAREQAQAQASRLQSRRVDAASVRFVIIIVAAAVVLGVVTVVWLIRTVLRRIVAASAFAERISAGQIGGRLDVAGRDEISRLGRVLNDIVERTRRERSYEETQSEFTETMQLAESEKEVHQLLKRHLERSLPGGAVTVLNRNNSADRLEPMTQLDPDGELATSLGGARPRACLAVRLAREHTASPGGEALLSCEVCGGCSTFTTCVPLLVSGEVIGSVLIEHERPLDEQGQQRVTASVTQGAPVLANLRNLAIAEMRAATDALTGLPNRRAIAEATKRMVAHSSRTAMPCALLLLDLDHFKQA